MTTCVRPDYDVVIVGTAIVGLTLACSLMDKGLRIAVLSKDNSEKSEISSASMLRFIAVTLGSQQLLQRLQAWQRLAPKQSVPFRSMQIWEAAKDASLFFDSAELGQPTLGYILKNDDLQHALFTQVKTDKEITWLSSETLVDIHVEKNQVVLVFASTKTVTTHLLVGADGVQSNVRELAGLAINTSDYQQRALIATVRSELIHKQIARQIFLPTGPLAFLPLADPHYCSIVWSTTPDEACRLKKLTDNQFCSELTNAFEHALGRIESTSMRLTFPLKTQEAQHYVKPGIALIGDAAHTIHPLAGQGANLGMADAECLARVIVEAKQKQRSLGALYTLRPYERERRFHNRLMNGSVDGIKHMFALKNPLLQNARQFGLSLINKMPILKNAIARYAMGNFII